MREVTTKKIEEAIEKLGKDAPYRQIAKEANTSLRSVTTYIRESGNTHTPEEIETKINQAKRQIMGTDRWVAGESKAFPTRARIAEATGLPLRVIDGYFEDKTHNKDKPFKGFFYEGPLKGNPIYSINLGLATNAG